MSHDNSHDNAVDLLKKNKKNKKTRFQNQRQEYTGEQKIQTQAISINITKADLKKKYSYIMYYNCNKYNHYLKFCLELLKNKYQS